VDDVLASMDDGIGVVRLNRPARSNSVTPEVVTELGRAVADMAGRPDIRAVILTGTGRVFCAGADVQEMHAVYRNSGADGLMNYLAEVWMPAVQRTVRLLWGVPKPLVAAFNGAATAGGLDFGLCCDLRIAADTARFAESYVNLGMVPVAGGAYLLPLTIGRTAAMDMLSSGTLIDAQTAREIGLVSEICSADDLPARARAAAERASRAPVSSLAAVKRLARAHQTDALDAALRASLAANIELITQEDVRHSIVAVMERYSRTANMSKGGAVPVDEVAQALLQRDRAGDAEDRA